MHFRSIHYLRGIAALLVAIFHSFSNAHFMIPDVHNVYWMRGGVDIFFVISGFVMVQSTQDKNITPREFVWNRIKRIVPLYWIASLAMITQFDGHWEFKLLSLIFIPAINPGNGLMQPLLEPGWTLNYEMFFYLVFSLTLLVSQNWRILTVALCFSAMVASGIVFDGGEVFQFYTRPILLEFVLGMVIAHYRLKFPGWTILVGLLAMMILIQLPVDRLWSFGIPAAIIVGGALGMEEELPKLRVFDLLGSASYSIYLFHLLALGIVIKFWSIFDLGNVAYVICANLIVVAVGISMYLALERPLQVMLRRKKPIDSRSFIPRIQTISALVGEKEA